jgi:DNA-binding transcriptional MerR regulator/quercetin dioxygenase-like cupin family protein
MLYPIREAARLTGVSPGLLRLWEREGLITPQRTAGGHRFYSDEDILRLRRITHLRRIERLNTAAIRRELGPAEKPLPPDASSNGSNAGPRLRAARLARGLSLAAAARCTGLSTSFLSAVERGQTSISLGNLFKLADAYGTTVPGLNAEYRSQERKMLRPDERPRFIANHGLVLIEDLITRPGALEAQRIEIQPGGGSEEPYSHSGEEFIYLLSGELVFWIDEKEKYLLKAGDSLYFLSTQIHHWRNESDAPTTALWINVPVVESPAACGRGTARRRPRTAF